MSKRSKIKFKSRREINEDSRVPTPDIANIPLGLPDFDSSGGDTSDIGIHFRQHQKLNRSSSYDLISSDAFKEDFLVKDKLRNSKSERKVKTQLHISRQKSVDYLDTKRNAEQNGYRDSISSGADLMEKLMKDFEQIEQNYNNFRNSMSMSEEKNRQNLEKEAAEMLVEECDATDLESSLRSPIMTNKMCGQSDDNASISSFTYQSINQPYQSRKGDKFNDQNAPELPVRRNTQDHKEKKRNRSIKETNLQQKISMVTKSTSNKNQSNNRHYSSNHNINLSCKETADFETGGFPRSDKTNLREKNAKQNLQKKVHNSNYNENEFDEEDSDPGSVRRGRYNTSRVEYSKEEIINRILNTHSTHKVRDTHRERDRESKFSRTVSQNLYRKENSQINSSSCLTRSQTASNLHHREGNTKHNLCSKEPDSDSDNSHSESVSSWVQYRRSMTRNKQGELELKDTQHSSCHNLRIINDDQIRADSSVSESEGEEENSEQIITSKNRFDFSRSNSVQFDFEDSQNQTQNRSLLNINRQTSRQSCSSSKSTKMSRSLSRTTSHEVNMLRTAKDGTSSRGSIRIHHPVHKHNRKKLSQSQSDLVDPRLDHHDDRTERHNQSQTLQSEALARKFILQKRRKESKGPSRPPPVQFNNNKSTSLLRTQSCFTARFDDSLDSTMIVEEEPESIDQYLRKPDLPSKMVRSMTTEGDIRDFRFRTSNSRKSELERHRQAREMQETIEKMSRVNSANQKNNKFIGQRSLSQHNLHQEELADIDIHAEEQDVQYKSINDNLQSIKSLILNKEIPYEYKRDYDEQSPQISQRSIFLGHNFEEGPEIDRYNKTTSCETEKSGLYQVAINNKIYRIAKGSSILHSNDEVFFKPQADDDDENDEMAIIEEGNFMQNRHHHHAHGHRSTDVRRHYSSRNRQMGVSNHRDAHLTDLEIVTSENYDEGSSDDREPEVPDLPPVESQSEMLEAEKRSAILDDDEIDQLKEHLAKYIPDQGQQARHRRESGRTVSGLSAGLNSQITRNVSSHLNGKTVSHQSQSTLTAVTSREHYRSNNQHEHFEDNDLNNLTSTFSTNFTDTPFGSRMPSKLDATTYSRESQNPDNFSINYAEERDPRDIGRKKPSIKERRPLTSVIVKSERMYPERPQISPVNKTPPKRIDKVDELIEMGIKSPFSSELRLSNTIGVENQSYDLEEESVKSVKSRGKDNFRHADNGHGNGNENLFPVAKTDSNATSTTAQNSDRSHSQTVTQTQTQSVHNSRSVLKKEKSQMSVGSVHSIKNKLRIGLCGQNLHKYVQHAKNVNSCGKLDKSCHMPVMQLQGCSSRSQSPNGQTRGSKEDDTEDDQKSGKSGERSTHGHKKSLQNCGGGSSLSNVLSCVPGQSSKTVKGAVVNVDRITEAYNNRPLSKLFDPASVLQALAQGTQDDTSLHSKTSTVISRHNNKKGGGGGASGGNHSRAGKHSKIKKTKSTGNIANAIEAQNQLELEKAKAKLFKQAQGCDRRDSYKNSVHNATHQTMSTRMTSLNSFRTNSTSGTTSRGGGKTIVNPQPCSSLSPEILNASIRKMSIGNSSGAQTTCTNLLSKNSSQTSNSGESTSQNSNPISNITSNMSNEKYIFIPELNRVVKYSGGDTATLVGTGHGSPTAGMSPNMMSKVSRSSSKTSRVSGSVKRAKSLWNRSVSQQSDLGELARKTSTGTVNSYTTGASLAIDHPLMTCEVMQEYNDMLKMSEMNMKYQ